MTNAERIERARAAVAAWRGTEPEDESNARDLMVDLLHLIEAEGDEVWAGGAEQQHRMAWDAYNEEREEEA